MGSVRLSRAHAPWHPKVCAQFLWETKAKVLVDFTPGAGMMAKASLMMGTKVIMVVHSEQRGKVLQSILLDFVVGDLQCNKTASKYAPQDFQARLDALKPALLSKFMSQRRSVADPAAETPDGKRMALAASLDKMLDSMSDPTSPKEKQQEKTKDEKKVQAKETQESKTESSQPIVQPVISQATGASV